MSLLSITTISANNAQNMAHRLYCSESVILKEPANKAGTAWRRCVFGIPYGLVEDEPGILLDA